MKKLAALALLLTVSAAVAQDKKPGPAKVDQQKVDEAIQKGVEYLKKTGAPESPAGGLSSELILLTHLHAGVPKNDPEFQKLFADMMGRELRHTYNVSLQAMVLEEVERMKYQQRIAQCAQFLVDNQSPQGHWAYGTPTTYDTYVPVPTGGGRSDVQTTAKKQVVDFSEPRGKPKVVTKIVIRKRRDGEGHDNSNSQYAALGLRACHDAGIVLPREVLERAEKYWRDTQCAEEGGRKEAYPARGWHYNDPAKTAYGSMSAGAVGSLCILDYIQGKNWKADKDVLSGIGWMAKHFSVTSNPGTLRDPGSPPTWFHLYYLYALERVGMLYGTDLIGKHDWYVEGATHLLQTQKADGSWFGPGPGAPWEHAAWDTCWAILFLRRATRPLNDVATTDRLNKR